MVVVGRENERWVFMDENQSGNRWEPDPGGSPQSAPTMPSGIASPTSTVEGATRPWWSALVSRVSQTTTAANVRRLLGTVRRTSVAVALGGLLIGGAAGFAIGHQGADSGAVEGSTSADSAPDIPDSGDGAPGAGPGGHAPGLRGERAPFVGQVPPDGSGSEGTGSFS